MLVLALSLCMLAGAEPLRTPRLKYTVSAESKRAFPLVVHGPALPIVTQVRDAADRAWQAEMVEGGWQAPAHLLDIYIDPALQQGEAFVDEDADGRTFIVLSPDFA